MMDYREAVVILVGLATAVLGWYYAKRTGLEQAKKEVSASQTELISSLERRLNEQERWHTAQLQDLDVRLKACEERWHKWSSGPIG